MVGRVIKLVTGLSENGDIFVVVVSRAGLFQVKVFVIFLTVGVCFTESAVCIFSDIHDVGRGFIERLPARLITATDDRIFLISSGLWNVRLISHL